jgi:hypothetical protein
MGTVRFAVGAETETDKRMRHEAKGTRPNIRNTRTEGLRRIDELKAEYAAAH